MSNPIIAFLFATAFSSAVAPAANAQDLPYVKGRFEPTEASLHTYRYPDWFRDAKFGIWAHWGPQAVPRHGDWYARKMYEEGSSDYRYHVTHYGHPSKFGYKDIIPLWKAERWDPQKLMALYKKAGARYFVSMGSHHDNFFLWNSKIHPWNAVQYGPHKDVVGIWQKAAKKEGLPFGVSEHLGASYTWWQVSHRSDTAGPMKGLPYDGRDPAFAELYHTQAEASDTNWLTTNPGWIRTWYADVEELVDSYHPDLLYSDSHFPFEATGRTMLANFYNGNMASHGGRLEAVYACKQASGGNWVQDLERGVQDSISAYPWQTDTSIGDWYYNTGQKYKTGTEILQMLVDIVSKNGNLLINIVQTPEGDLEPDILKTLDEIAKWIAVNGEGIYGTRPWKVFGEKPASDPVVKAANFNEDQVKYSSNDIRFTTKGPDLYSFCLDVPTGQVLIRSLGKHGLTDGKKVSSVIMLGSNAKIRWEQKDAGLEITMPDKLPDWKVIGFRIGLN